MSKAKATGENITQGSIGGAVLSSANLDKTLSAYFNGSDCEISYGDLRLSVLSFQDDALRMVSTLEAAQKGNILIESAMKRKQLSLHPGKCSILAFEKKNKVGQIRELINSGNSIKIGNQPILAKVKEE